MNIVYENFIEDSVLAATDINNNFPLANLYSRFLLLPYRSVSDAAVTITITFPEDRDIDSGFVGYHNLESMQIKTYDSIDTLLDDSGVLPMYPGIDGVYYSDALIENARKVELILLTTNQAYFEIGGVSIGKKLSIDCIETPDFESSLGGGFDKSITGQITGDFSVGLKSFDFTVPNISHTQKVEIERMLTYNGKFKPLWLDIYPGAHVQYQPIFSNITRAGNFKKQDGRFLYDTKLSFEECK